MDKYVLGRLNNGSKSKKTMDPARLNEPITLEELLELVHVLNNLSVDIDAFKDKINKKLTKEAHSKRSYIGTMLLRHLFLFSFVWQVVNVVVATFLYPTKGQGELNTEELAVVVSLMASFQILHLLLVFITSIKLCRKVLHKKAAPLFVAQSFLSTLLLYGGMYTLIYCMLPDAFAGLHANDTPIVVATRLLYFSTATMTTAGYGDITPTRWFTELLVTSQMLVSLTYTVIIFSQGLAHFNTPYIIPKKKNDHIVEEARRSLLMN